MLIAGINSREPRITYPSREPILRASRQFLDNSKVTLVNAPSLRFADIAAAGERLRGVATHTPVLRIAELDARSGNVVFVKCENLQRIGAFKFRGAYNRLAQLTPLERSRGVVAFSSGNHAAGVALAAKILGVTATIVMPEDAPAAKMQTTKELGARVVPYDRRSGDREAIAAQIVSETNATLVPPFDDYRVMAGQGTTALELCQDVGDLDALLVPLGGGGLLSGCAVAARELCKNIEIYGVEPQAGDDWQQSFARGERVTVSVAETIADGLRSPAPGELTWPIVHQLASGVVTVSDDEIRSAMRQLFEAGRLIAEPSGAVAVAAAIFRKTALRGKRVGVVISGGNVDSARFCELVEQT
jgi:threonine dehydratase